jgi:8-oxo-(d)GTP phosphatase
VARKGLRKPPKPRVTRLDGQGDAKVLAAGGVLWRGDDDAPEAEREIAVVHRPKYDDWSLPKGKVDEGEQLIVTARREVCEETGAVAHCGPVVGEQRYRVAAGPKYVRYWAMKYAGGEFEAQDEVDTVRWLPMKRALRTMSYSHDRQLVQRFADAPTATATVLLVRHAKAGSKKRWKGDDALRPIDVEGREQAARVAAVAPCYGPERILAADLVRCADTVLGVSVETGVALDLEPRLTGAKYQADPQATVDLVRELVALGGTSVLCSQGEVIPDLIHRLADRTTLRLRRPPSRKGSIWALSFGRDGALLTADYDAYLRPAIPA